MNLCTLGGMMVEEEGGFNEEVTSAWSTTFRGDEYLCAFWGTFLNFSWIQLLSSVKWGINTIAEVNTKCENVFEAFCT